ncbi:hypothetical protein [Sabulicella glaciei]|uniref:Uncharacterized protein n=1 Tax=Sabulicella glaciei TaxID=2984948 RepID=A0ABT3NV93_9PROT|nr:hypothetical protein [Roseococcus sp. MDT2-1-1]MCW8086083.1 hypothetical protein [Roseococcus sp. MDT2-1-1]
MKRVFLAALLALSLALPAAAQRSGTYDVTGRNPDGTDYTGTLLLTQIGLSTFRVQWVIGQDEIEGVAMVSGLTFATAFTLGEQTGMGIYQLQPDGSLVGVWTTAGAFAQGEETARPR